MNGTVDAIASDYAALIRPNYLLCVCHRRQGRLVPPVAVTRSRRLWPAQCSRAGVNCCSKCHRNGVLALDWVALHCIDRY